MFVWDFFSKKSILSPKKLVFIYLDNFFKNNQNIKKFVFNFFIETEKNSFEKNNNFQSAKYKVLILIFFKKKD